ncbi:MAG: PhzF family phenazine biosynthesis protein [Acinetobacter sp.]
MITLKQYILDAFSNRQFGGNSAAVIVLEHWLPDDFMLKIAQQNNLSETAFLVRQTEDWHIRWFSPIKEIDFCGHASLASAEVLLHFYQEQNHYTDSLKFYCRAKGQFSIQRLSTHRYQLNFPNEKPELVTDIPEDLLAGLSLKPIEVYRNGQAYFVVYDSSEQVKQLEIDVVKIKKLDPLDVVATAKGQVSDFVCRYFWPAGGGYEDPVTGSIHAGLFPFWAERLQKDHLISHQVSTRLGILEGQLLDDRVLISGDVVLFSESQLFLING